MVHLVLVWGRVLLVHPINSLDPLGHQDPLEVLDLLHHHHHIMVLGVCIQECHRTEGLLDLT